VARRRLSRIAVGDAWPVSAARQDARMKTSRSTKAERRAHRKARSRHRGGDRSSVHGLGGLMDPDLADRIMAATRGVDVEAPWPEIAPMILPILKRVRHPYPPDAAPMHVQVPPGIPTGFGIDFGPAFSHVTAPMLERWGIDRATLLATSLVNLRRVVGVEPPQVQRFPFEGVELVAIQGQGWGSSLLLLPDVLGLILDTTPRILLAPVRNTLIALPEDVDTELAMGVWDAVADGAHDELDVEPLRWTGTSVVGIGDPARGLPN
jgi:hypothetical protein